jgi:uncharacterized protein YbaR (Trm112 family)
MALDPELLTVLACPIDKGTLHVLDDENALYNSRLKRRYHVREGIAVMLVDESEVVSDAEHDRIMAKVAATGAPTTGRG